MQENRINTIEEVIFQARELMRLGDHKQAYKVCRKAVSSGSSHPEFLLLYGVCAYASEKSGEAIKLLRKSLRLRPGFKDSLFNLGHILLSCGHPVDAIGPLSQLVDVHPEFPGAQANLAVAFYSSGQLQAAEHACQKAIDLVPDKSQAAELYNLLGSINRESEFNAQSEDAFRKALQINPGYGDALANLCMMLEESAQLEAASEASRDGIKRFSDDPRFSLVLAKCERRQGETERAIERLSKIDLEHEVGAFQAQVYFELGRLWDRKNTAQEAYKCFSKANDITALNIPGDIHKTFYPKVLKASSRYYARGGVVLPENKVASLALTPCFLIGFPRSGTTLLELTLAGHPDIAVMEEPPLIQELYADITNTNLSYPMVLAQLDDERIASLRQKYFDRAMDYTDLAGKRVLINKHPLDTVFLPVINAVFPDAKIIFSARHPLDVCLSCWMQEFQLNAGNVNFLSLSKTAEFYAATMDLWMHFQCDTDMEHLIVSYEDMVDNFAETARKATEFLGLDWSASVLDHTGTAKSLPRVNTASYYQVTEPLYVRSKNRWRKYRQYLEPILPGLRRYVEHFNYTL